MKISSSGEPVLQAAPASKLPERKAPKKRGGAARKGAVAAAKGKSGKKATQAKKGSNAAEQEKRSGSPAVRQGSKTAAVLAVSDRAFGAEPLPLIAMGKPGSHLARCGAMGIRNTGLR